MPVGKIVDHFMFKRHGKAFEVPVRMHKTAERYDGPGSSRHAGTQQTREVIFGVELDDPKICLWSTDIEALRSAVMSKLADHYEIAWEEWWIVEVGEGYLSTVDGGESVELSRHECLIGDTPEGEKVHRIPRFGGGDEIRKGWPEISTKRTRRDRGSTALVKATDVNTNALEDFAKRLKLLRDRLKEFLSPQQIAVSLQKVGALLQPQLPAPKATKAVKAEDMTPHVPKVSTKAPRKKRKKGEKPLPEIKKPKTMKKCKDGRAQSRRRASGGRRKTP
jgi:hypothetical protein